MAGVATTAPSSVFGQFLEFLASLDHGGLAVLAEEVEPAFGQSGDARCDQPLLPVNLAAPRIGATRHAVVGDPVKLVAHQTGDDMTGIWRGRFQATCVVVTSPWPSARTAQSCGLKQPVLKNDHAMAENRAGADGETLAMPRAPEFLASGGS